MRGHSDVVKRTGRFTLPTLRENGVREIDLPEWCFMEQFTISLRFIQNIYYEERKRSNRRF